MDKVGCTDVKVASDRGEIVPKDFAAAVKDIKLAILQSRARAAHASNVDAIHDQDVDERVLSKSLVANIEKTIQALGGDDFCVHPPALPFPRPGHRRRPPRTCQRA